MKKKSFLRIGSKGVSRAGPRILVALNKIKASGRPLVSASILTFETFEKSLNLPGSHLQVDITKISGCIQTQMLFV